MKFVLENNFYTHIGAINHLYNDLNIYRDIIFFEDVGLIIIDRYSSNNIQFMGQNFNLAPDIQITKNNGQEYELKTPGNQQFVIKEHTDRTLSMYFDSNNPNRGFYSLKFNELLPTQQIEFRKNSFSSTFLTSLTIKNEELDSVIITKENAIQFKLNGTEYTINLQKLN